MKRVIRVLVVALTLSSAFISATPANASNKPIVYLTFDDGPNANTERYLDLLAEFGIQGTFFVTGESLNRPSTVASLQRMVDEGHAIGNHSWNHANLGNLSYSSVVNQFASTNTQVSISTSNNYQMTCYRPPYGSVNQTVVDAAASQGLTNSEWVATYPTGHKGGWSIDTSDYKGNSGTITYNLNLINGIGGTMDNGELFGEVVLMHDIHRYSLAPLRSWLNSHINDYEFRTLPGCGADGHTGPSPDANDSSRWYEFSIERLYRSYFGRSPESDGFEYWKGRYTTGDINLYGMSDFFSISPEFQQLYGDTTNLEFVELVYNNVLGRPSDAEGKAYWVSALEAGDITWGELMLFFSDSDEYVTTQESSITGNRTYETEAQERWASQTS